jgi:hypothetical protein
MGSKGMTKLQRPFALLGILLLITRPMLGFKVPTHLAITHDVLQRISRTYLINDFERK